MDESDLHPAQQIDRAIAIDGTLLAAGIVIVVPIHSLEITRTRVLGTERVVEADKDLVPAQRYARMRNVWCVPTVASMQAWLRESGFADIQVIDVSATTGQEQRSTTWMRFESLSHALDPEDPSKTVEGYPRPVRAVLMARKTV